MKKSKKNESDLLGKIIKASELSATKQRLGLFSMPVPLAIGAQTFKPKRAKKDQDGKVITKKRGIYASSSRKGILPKDMFDGSIYMTNGKFPDPYMNSANVGRFRRKKGKSAGVQKHKDPFYLSTSKFGEYRVDRKLRYGNPYEFFSRKERKLKKKIKDADGKVIIGKLILIKKVIYRKKRNICSKLQNKNN